jgi:hypothetical protein
MKNSKLNPVTEGNLDIERLYWWCVLMQNKIPIIRELSGLGITHRTVYPDLDGIAKILWETEVLWSRWTITFKSGGSDALDIFFCNNFCRLVLLLAEKRT